ncbi:MAG: glycosyltransferase [Rectinemataceae bacterium]
MPKRILVLADVPLARDSRIRRQLEFLAEGYDVTCISRGAAPVAGIRYLEAATGEPPGLIVKGTNAMRLLTGAFEQYYNSKPFIREAPRLVEGEAFDLIVANDVDTLPLALSLAAPRKAKVLLDAHEFSPEQFSNSLRWRLLFGKYLDKLCKKYLKKADAMVTVCDSIADLYKRRYGVDARVVTNAPSWQPLEPGPVSAGRIRMINHGAINPNRGTLEMVRVLDFLPECFSLTLMLVNNGAAYGDKLRALQGPRLNFIDPVAPERVAEKINEYDIGLYLLPPRNVNQKYALPNKFFEFVQGRLAIAVGPSPEMAAYVRRYDLGVVSDDFSPEALAMRLRELTSGDIMRFKKNSDVASRSLSAEENRKVFLECVRRLIG